MSRAATRLVQTVAATLDPRAIRNPTPRGHAHRLRSWWATNWRAIDPTMPSFMASLERQRRVIEQPAADQWRMLLSDKLRTYELAEPLGIKTPAVIAAWNDALEIDLRSAPSRMCCKPVRATAGHGVLLLDRVSTDAWRDQHGIVRSHEELRAHFARLDLQPVTNRPLIYAEEWVRSSQHALDDWKLYSFRGTVGLVLQLRRHAKGLPTMRFWSGDFEPLGAIRTPERCDLSLPEPVAPIDLLDAAQKISEAVPLPFVRVDLYETTSGVVLGELSPAPGRIHLFPPELDQYLGMHFERAEAELSFRQ